MIIKLIKLNENIYQGLGLDSEFLPKNLEEFKTIAIDTVNWQIGDSVKKALGNTHTNLSASNAKAVALLAKVVASLNPTLNGLTELETDSYSKMVALADGGYADSELLNSSLSNVTEFIAKGTDKATRVGAAQSIDEVVAILNEV